MGMEHTLPDPRPIGDLTLAEMRSLEDVLAREEALLRRIGELEVERHRLVVAAAAISEHSEAILATVAARLNIPAGTEWTVSRNGTVCVVLP